MFEANSRYAKIQTATLTDAGGHKISYVRRRILPRSAELPTLAEVRTTEGERLDLLTARALGDPEQFWRICDANDALNPSELTAQPGAIIRIPMPQPQ